MRRTLTVAILAFVVAVPSAWAGNLAGVSMPDQVTVGDATLHLNGMGLRSKLWVKVYVAGLYVEQKSSSVDAIVNAPGAKKIVMNFLTNKAKKKKMDAAWHEGFKGNSPANFKALEKRVKNFMNLFGNMKDGDKLELVVIPGEGTHATYNGKKVGTIKGDDFGKALLLVWLGKAPPSDEMKAGLLGK